MAEHAGQKRAVVQFLKHGKKVDEHRAKGRESASDDPEDAHEVQGGIDHNNPMTIFHRDDDAHERAVSASASASEPHLWAEHVTTRANKGSKGRWKKRMEYKTRSLERDKKERAQTRRGDRESSSLARTAFMPVLLLLACLLTRSGSSRMACVRFDSFYTESGYDKVTVRQGSSSGTNMSEFSRIYVYFSSENIQTRNTIASACPVVGKYETSGCFTCNSCAPSGQ